MAIRILAFDGGGVRGAFSARLLQRLEEKTGGGLVERTTVLAGTSTGAILAAGLACGLRPDELVDLYVNYADHIFDRSAIPLIGIWTAPYTQRRLRQQLRTRYQAGLDRLLAALPVADATPVLARVAAEKAREAAGDFVYPSLGLLAMLKRFVVVPAFSLHEPPDQPVAAARSQPVIMHNLPRYEALLESGRNTTEKHWLDNLSIVEAVLRSSAAPTYFPARHKFVDGGVVANNPSVAAWALVKDVATAMNEKDDVRVLSISSGHSPNARPELDRKGVFGWVRPLVDMFIDGSAELATQHCQVLLGPRHHRLDGPLGEALHGVKLDHAPAVSFLVARADELAGEPVGGISKPPADSFVRACEFVRYQFKPPGPFYIGRPASGAEPIRARELEITDYLEDDGTCTTLTHFRGLVGKTELPVTRDFSTVPGGVGPVPRIEAVEILGADPRDLKIDSAHELGGSEFVGRIRLPPGRPVSLCLKTVVRNGSVRNLKELQDRYPHGVPDSDWTHERTPVGYDHSEWKAPCYCELAIVRTVFGSAYRVGEPRAWLIDPIRTRIVLLPSTDYPAAEWDPATFLFRMRDMEPGQVFRLIYPFT